MSGSMWPLATDVRGGHNNYVAELRTKGEGFRLTTTVFNTGLEHICLDATLNEVPELNNVNYNPRGGTALLDAVGKTVTAFESRTKLRKADRILVVIQTDGEENSSREWTSDGIKQLISAREGTDQWGFIYLGQGIDTWSQADSIGIQRSQYINTNYSATGTASSWSGLYSAGTSWAAGRSIGQTVKELRETPGVEKKD